jgi:hypothetical protein
MLKGRSLRDAKLLLKESDLKLGYTEELPSNNPAG